MRFYREQEKAENVDNNFQLFPFTSTMSVNPGQTFSQTDGTTKIDTILTQEANRIGPDIHQRTLHASPWIDLTKQTTFPDGMGYLLGTLIYERALPLTAANLSNMATVGLQWTDIGGDAAASKLVDGASMDQLLADARDTNIGPQTGKSFIHFARMLKQYSLRRAVVESPRINVEDLRFAAHRKQQLSAAIDAMTRATRYSWEERYRDEYERLSANLVLFKTTGTLGHIYKTVNDGDPFEGVQVTGVNYDEFGPSGNVEVEPDANLSNKVLDTIYQRLIRAGGGTDAWGRENGRPVFSLVLSSEASYALMTESGFRDDVRYNNSRVSELLAPLGVEKSWRGFYHLVDDLTPRFNYNASTKKMEPVPAYIVTADAGVGNAEVVVIDNPAYDSADFEAAYVLHQKVMESQIPAPISGDSGLKFDPLTYKGDFKWRNIPHEVINPDGTIGFFRGVLASASKPIHTEFGYVLLFKRTSTTPGA